MQGFLGRRYILAKVINRDAKACTIQSLRDAERIFHFGTSDEPARNALPE
jgi:hypothetical protein